MKKLTDTLKLMRSSELRSRFFRKRLRVTVLQFTRLIIDASPLLPAKDNTIGDGEVSSEVDAKVVVIHKHSISDDADMPFCKKLHTCHDQFSLHKRIVSLNLVINVYSLLESPDSNVMFILSNDLANSVPKNTRLPVNLKQLNINWTVFRKWSKSKMKESIHQRVSKCYLLDNNLQRFILSHNWDLGSALLKLIS